MQRAPFKLLAAVLGAGLLAGCETMGELGDTAGGWYDSATSALSSSDEGYIARKIGDDVSEEDAEAIGRAVAKALERAPAGREVTWKSKTSGASATFKPGGTRLEKREIEAAMRKGVVVTPNMVLIARGYTAARNANLRAGPGTDHKVVGGLAKGESLTALGAVGKGDWILVALDGEVVGYVYAPLVAPDARARVDLRDSGSAGRPRAGEGLSVETMVVSTSCRTMSYTVRPAEGEPTEDQFHACKAGDGAWEIN